jgi:thioesterase domain-containing protein
VEAMAAAYVAEIRIAHPAGPYRLGGWSMGGLVALEMARLLIESGDTVELVVLADTRAPGSATASVDEDDPALLEGFVRHLGIDGALVDPSAPPADRLRAAWQAARAADVIPPDLELDRFGRLWRVFRANVAAAAAYRPSPVSTGLLVLLAADRAADADAEAARWSACATGEIRTAVIPGNHFSIIREPGVRALAEEVGSALVRSTSVRP